MAAKAATHDSDQQLKQSRYCNPLISGHFFLELHHT